MHSFTIHLDNYTGQRPRTVAVYGADRESVLVREFLEHNYGQAFRVACFIDFEVAGTLDGLPVIQPKDVGSLDFRIHMLVIHTETAQTPLVESFFSKIGIQVVHFDSYRRLDLFQVDRETIARDVRHAHFLFPCNASLAIKGAFAEFGVFDGRSAVMFTIMLQGFGKHLYFFDSFEGFPEPADSDATTLPVQSGGWVKGQMRASITPRMLEMQLSQFAVPEEIHVCPGYFSRTLPTIPQDTRFALIHIDCDLYSSTYEALDYLFGHGMILPGCIILFDDYYHNLHVPTAGEQGAWTSLVDKYAIRHRDMGPYPTSGHKFVIVSYGTGAAPADTDHHAL